MKKLNLDFKKIESEVDDVYLINEYKGIYESYLHLNTQLKYLQSAEGKKAVCDALGSEMYEKQLHQQVQNLIARTAELDYMKKEYK